MRREPTVIAPRPARRYALFAFPPRAGAFVTRSQRSLLGAPAPWMAQSVCALLVAACGGGAGPTDASNSGGDVTASYAAAFASGAQSGTLTLTTHTSGQAGGSMVTVGGVTAALSGTYSASTG